MGNKQGFNGYRVDDSDPLSASKRPMYMKDFAVIDNVP